jgi:hypothetical protein
MPRFPFLRHARVTLLALVLVAAAAMLLLVTPPPAAALICGAGNYPSVDVTYYSGPEHKKEVGEYFGCAGDLTGQETDYYISLPVCCPGD